MSFDEDRFVEIETENPYTSKSYGTGLPESDVKRYAKSILQDPKLITVEMLLDHPFLIGMDEPKVSAIPSSSWTEADFEHGGYSFSDDDDSTSCSFCAER
nr:hypothetical protein CFP56_77944 [Quercus suber]